MSSGLSHRCSSDLVLVWLWLKLVATARIQPLAWEPTYAMGVALNTKDRKKKKKKGKETFFIKYIVFFKR